MMVIPTINCFNFECVKEKIEKAAAFLPSNNWAQIDIGDGVFGSTKTWNNPAELKTFLTSNKPAIKIEAHLMLKNPASEIEHWIISGVKRIIVHAEALNSNQMQIINLARKNLELGIAIRPDTPVEKLLPFIDCGKIKDCFRFVQILAVRPGRSGQKFGKEILPKISYLKKNFPNAIIEIDGGINLETGKLCKEAGADILVAGAFIWNSADPRRTFYELSSI